MSFESYSNNINTIKLLSMDMIEQAKSGHPGMVLGCAMSMYVLFEKMRFNPEDPEWINRDRFILSNGHGSSLLYSMLHLFGYNITIDDLKKFRQINSKTPGHPEIDRSLGIEVTTGPLGQGISNGVGMAIASKNISSRFNNDKFNIIDNNIFVMCGDGCLMEGVACEAISLAGSLCLNNLILLYDDNNITIDGRTDITFTDNTEEKFKSMGWDVCVVNDANRDYQDISNKIDYATNSKKPCLIILKTKIGFESEKEDSEKSHGSPLGSENVIKLKEKYGFNPDDKFVIKSIVSDEFKEKIKLKKENYNKWLSLLGNYKLNEEKLFLELNDIINKDILKDGLSEYMLNFSVKSKKDVISTRKLSGIMLDCLSKNRNIIMGSADLASSNCIPIKDVINKDNFNGNYIHYGVREHAMCGIANGIETFGLQPIIGTFLVFSTYCLGSIRVAALSKHKVIYIFTHDSIGMGEDGPTHQPIETLTTLRALPNVLTLRPADRYEIISSYKLALKYNGPSCICLSRQDLPNLDEYTSDDSLKGGYIVYQNAKKEPLDLILISSGSELNICLSVASKYKGNIRVVSMLSTEVFDSQVDEYRNYILPKDVKKVSVEAGATLGWFKYADICYGIDTFGLSGKGSDVMDHYGFTFKKILQFINEL